MKSTASLKKDGQIFEEYRAQLKRVIWIDLPMMLLTSPDLTITSFFIDFIAKYCPESLCSTKYTFPKEPRPITFLIKKSSTLT